MTLLGIDVSHHQGAIDFAAVKKAGFSFVILKATESTNFTDSTFAANRAKAHAAGLVVGAYHFARAGNPAAEADYFCKVVGALTPGEFVVLDWEVPAPNPPAWCKTWLDRVAGKLGAHPLIYMNQSARDGFDWSPVVSGNYGLWLAKYDGSQTVPSSGRWPNVAMKQLTDKGSVPGVAGGVDVDVFFGDATALAAYGFQGDDMPTVADIWLNGTINPVTKKTQPVIDLLKDAVVRAEAARAAAAAAAVDAAIARKLAEQAAAAGRALTQAEIDAIGTKLASELSDGYKVVIVPDTTA